MQDQQLIDECKRGNTQALCRIYRKYRKSLLVLAVALTGSMTDAEDVLHDTFLRFVRNLDDFELTGRLKAYLSVCVANQARNLLKRSRYRQAAGFETIELMVSGQEGPQQRAMCNETLRLLSGALSQLPIEQREVIALHHQGSMTLAAIARQRHVSVATIKSRYRYGILKLRSILKQEVTS